MHCILVIDECAHINTPIPQYHTCKLISNFECTVSSSQISPRPSEALELERERSQSFNDTQASNKSYNNNNFNNTEFTNYAISTRDYTLPGSKDEQLEIGSAFLKVCFIFISFSCLILARFLVLNC